MRSGAFFIPLLMILARTWGLPGIMYAQPIADVLAGLCSVPFLIPFFRKLPKEDAPV